MSHRAYIKSLLFSLAILCLICFQTEARAGKAGPSSPSSSDSGDNSMAPPPSPSNEEMDFGVVTKSFLDRLFGKGDSTSASGEGMDAELEALLEREGQVNIITLRSDSAPETMTVAMTVSSDEVFEADHEKIQLDVGGHKLESASSSSASSSSSSSTPATKALLQLRKRTGHGTSTNSTHAATNALKIAKHPTLTFEGVGDYQMHTKLGEGSYGVAYLYQNKKDPKDMMVVKVMKTEDDSKGGVEKAVDFIKGVFNRNAEKRELTPEEKFLMKLETFQMKDECAKAQELNMLIPDTPAGLTPFMQCLTYMRESDIKKHHVSLPVPAKAGLGLGERQYMVLDKAGDTNLSKFRWQVNDESMLRMMPAIAYQLIAAVDIMTNNDKGIAYVHADLKPDNIVVGVPEEKTKGSSTDDSGCDIHPRVTMIDFGGMFRLSKRGPTDRLANNIMNMMFVIRPAITKYFAHPKLVAFLTLGAEQARKDSFGLESGQAILERPWLVDLFSIQKIIDEMLHSILHPKSKVMTMRRERFNKDPKLREILKAFSSGPLVEMGTDEDLTPAILLQHPIFASFLEADSVQRARAKTGGSEGSASTSTGSVTNPGSVNDDDDLVDDIEWPSDSSDTWTESLPRSNTDDAYVCLKRDFSAMSPLLQKVMRAGDYTPLASSEIQKWDSVSTEASGEAAFFVTRVEIFTWYVQAPESARGPTASERLFFITGNTETLGDFDFEKKIPLELDADESEDAGKQVYTADVHLPVLPVVYRVLEVDAVTKKVIFQTGLLLK